jgi:hypothetical protein
MTTLRDDPRLKLRASAFVLVALGLGLAGACSKTHTVAEGAKDSPQEGGASGQGDGDGDESVSLPPEVPVCEPTGEAENACDDGADDDCDGFSDCRDTECEGAPCGSEEGFSCQAGACLSDSEGGLPELPVVQNLKIKMLGTTAVVSFEPVPGARDYRIYPLPDPADVLLGEDGEVVIPGAIYRCAGDRPATRRADDQNAHYDASLTTEERIHGYVRPEGSELLGYVYVTPGPGRAPVYRVTDPNRKGGYIWPNLASWDQHYHGGFYTSDSEERTDMIAAGHIDSGVAFYAPNDGDLAVHRRIYPEGEYLSPLSYYTDGPEADARASHSGEHATPFAIYSEQVDGTVPLYRVYYLYEGGHDTLAAGEPAFERALEQGNVPYWSLTWPGLTGDTTLVIEALDQGCPFPGGYVSAHSAPGNIEEAGYYPTFTVEEARIESDEVFINGQHDPANRPKPLARAYVDVTPEPAPDMDWYESFDDASTWAPLTEVGDPAYINLRNDDWIVEMNGCTDGTSVGPVLGQLALGGGDGGSSCNMSVIPRDVGAELRSGEFLHVRMTTEIPSSRRRYPQLMVTTTPVLDESEFEGRPVYEFPVRNRLGPLPFEEGYEPHQGEYKTLIVQPFGPESELQVEFCNGRGWGVSVQCPRANIYGYQASGEGADETVPWNPVPILGELAGHDRPVRFDAYLSTSRVYVYVNDEPAGCAILPSGEMPEGPVTVIFGSVIYHGIIDESVEPEASPHQYLRRYSLVHYDRHFDEVGIDQDAALPGWDETRLPCGEVWYGADE